MNVDQITEEQRLFVPAPRRFARLNQEHCFALAILTQLAILWQTGGFTLFVSTMAVLVIATQVVPWKLNVGMRFRFWCLVLAALFFVLKSRVAPHELPSAKKFISTELILSLSEMMVALQWLQLVFYQHSGRIPRIVVGLALTGMVFACDVQSSSDERSILQVLIGMCVLLLMGVFIYERREVVPASGRGRRSLYIATTAVCVASLLTASLASHWLFNHEQRLDQWLLQFLDPPRGSSAIGFSGRSRLGSVQAVKSNEPSAVALRIHSERDPGYLRGRAFVTYQNSEWTTFRNKRSLAPEPANRHAPVETWPNDRVYHLNPQHSGIAASMTTWQYLDVDGALFLPLDAKMIAMSPGRLLLSEDGTTEAPDLELGASYRTGVGGSKVIEPLSEIDREVYLRLPDNLDPRILLLAEKLFEGTTTARQKVLRVVGFFHNHFKYNFGIQVPEGVDPLVYFLTEQPPAHCEYFATATAILLRAGGVPSRYVTGFVAADQNQFTSEWTVRNEHAHAWVEAWDDESGWQTVESTPSSGLPQSGEKPGASSQLLDSIKSWWRRTRDRWSQGGWSQIKSDLLWILTGPVGWLVLGWIVLRTWQRLRRPKVISKDPPLPASHRNLNRLLQRLLRRLAKHGHAPQSGETLNQFASRLKADNETGLVQTAEWIEQYAAVRYRPSIDSEQETRLREQLPSI